jgi:hypothetical protein
MVVLGIAELRPGAEANKLSGVAEGLDAYYTGAGPVGWRGSRRSWFGW